MFFDALNQANAYVEEKRFVEKEKHTLPKWSAQLVAEESENKERLEFFHCFLERYLTI